MTELYLNYNYLCLKTIKSKEKLTVCFVKLKLGSNFVHFLGMLYVAVVPYNYHFCHEVLYYIFAFNFYFGNQYLVFDKLTT